MADVRTLADLIAREYGVRTRARFSAPGLQAGVAISRAAIQAPNRIGLTMVNLSANVIYISPDSVPSATHGIRLAPSGGNITLNWREDTHLVGLEWSMLGSAAASDITVIETLILDPRAG
jgi:hypothetical protein